MITYRARSVRERWVLVRVVDKKGNGPAMDRSLPCLTILLPRSWSIHESSLCGSTSIRGGHGDGDGHFPG